MLCLYLEWISFLFIFTSLWFWLSNFIHYFLVAEVSASRITHTLDLINLIFSIRVLLFEFASPIWDFTIFQLLFRFHSVSIRWIFLRFLERCLWKFLITISFKPVSQTFWLFLYFPLLKGFFISHRTFIGFLRSEMKFSLMILEIEIANFWVVAMSSVFVSELCFLLLFCLFKSVL